jgi:hypothetical protein
MNDWFTRINVDNLLTGIVEAANKAGFYALVPMAGLRSDEFAFRFVVDLISRRVLAAIIQTPSSALEKAVRSADAR